MASAATILFGAFDRHNFGDLLFPHIVAALLPGRTHYFAGLAARDMRPYGGHLVQALAALAPQLRGEPVNLVHVGGELLTCSAHEAAVMLLEPQAARAVLASPRQEPLAVPGSADRIPYIASPALFPDARLLFNAVGGVDLNRLEAQARAEVVHKLRAAHWLGARDRETLAALQARDIRAQLLPDCAVMVAELFGASIAQRMHNGEPARIASAFPRGYTAVQFSADFDDDATLATLAAQLDRIAARQRLGIVLFRAGAAPWHDALDPYRKLAHYMGAPAQVFTSPDIWDICALIAGSRAYCGSSLHGRIVAAAYALPRANLMHPGIQDAGKQGAYAATWDTGLPGCVPVTELAQAMEEAMAFAPTALGERAGELVAAYRSGFAELAAALA